MSAATSHHPIRTIFWDVGGVLLTNGWDQEQRARVLTRLEVDLAAYELLHDAANFYWERGLQTAQGFFTETVLRSSPWLSFDELWPQVCAESKVLHPECLDMLAKLKERGGCKMATLNNESRELNEYRLDAFHLRPLFDYFICSGYVHEMKPQPGIYQAAIDVSGFDPCKGLLIDDKLENCEAAIKMGMEAICFESPAQLCNALTQFGINI